MKRMSPFVAGLVWLAAMLFMAVSVNAQNNNKFACDSCYATAQLTNLATWHKTVVDKTVNCKGQVTRLILACGNNWLLFMYVEKCEVKEFFVPLNNSPAVADK